MQLSLPKFLSSFRADGSALSMSVIPTLFKRPSGSSFEKSSHKCFLHMIFSSFCFTINCQSILIIVPLVRKLVGSRSNILFPTHITRKQLNYAFAVTVKTRICFKCFFHDMGGESVPLFNIIASKTTWTATFSTINLSFLRV